MAKRVGYIRMSQSGPTHEEQSAALRSAGVIGVHFDLVPRPSDEPGKRYRGRAAAIAELEPGDELVIASPSRIGATRSDVLTTLEAIGARQAALFVVSMGKRLIWTPEALAVADFAGQAESESRAEVTRHMRLRKAQLGVRSGPKPKIVEGTDIWNGAKVAWEDPTTSANQVARAFNVSVPTLYRRFGAKGAGLGADATQTDKE